MHTEQESKIGFVLLSEKNKNNKKKHLTPCLNPGNRKLFSDKNPKQSSWVRIHAPSLNNSKQTRCLKDKVRRQANTKSCAGAVNNMRDRFQKSWFCMWCYSNSFGVGQVKHFGWDGTRSCVFACLHMHADIQTHIYCRGCKSANMTQIWWPTN